MAVLTPQKYNDAAVRRFFRKAADAQKPVVVVLNLRHYQMKVLQVHQVVM